MAPPSTHDESLPADAFLDGVVQVVVGKYPERKTFAIHKRLASFYSGYFAAATKDCFKEGKSGIIDLPTENVKVFGCFVDWLYTLQWDRKQSTGLQSPGEAAATYNLICQTWMFADRRQIPLLMNDMVDEMRAAMLKFWSTPTNELRSIYSNTVATSGLRRFVIAAIINISGSSTMTDDIRQLWPEDALWDALKLAWDRQRPAMMGKEDFRAWSLCIYHQHEAGVTCPGA